MNTRKKTNLDNREKIAPLLSLAMDFHFEHLREMQKFVKVANF